MRELSRRARWLAAAVLFLIAFVIVFVVAGGLGTSHSVTIRNFQRSGDPRQIVVTVMVGLSYEITEHSAREDATTVTVIVRGRAPSGSWPAIGIFIPVPITLQHDLGDRTVLDDTGRSITDLGLYRPPEAPSQ